MKIIYNKLVRDRIPEIIESDGKKANYRILNDEEFIEALKDKLIEEAKELKEAETRKEQAEELADILEVFSCLAEALLIDRQIILLTGFKKINTKGSFDKKIFLESVLED